MNEREHEMATVTSDRHTSVKREVVVHLDESEYLECKGDRKPNGGRREARLTKLSIAYRWGESRWLGSAWSIKGCRQQQKANGEWGAPDWTNHPDLEHYTREQLVTTHAPTTTIIITEQENI